MGYLARALLAASLLLTGCAVPPIETTCNCASDNYPYPRREGPLACPIEPGSSESPYRNLVFQGGGVKAIAYGGALDELALRGDLARLERLAGTSAGAITAALLAVGYDGCSVANFTMEFDFEKLKDGSFIHDAAHALSAFGWYRGDYFQCAMECAIARRPDLEQRSTFGDLHLLARNNPTYKDLYVIAANLNTEQAVVFSHEQHGDVAIADAVRMSMSIPLFFEARSYRDDVYVDGGIVDNYPIGVFDREPFCDAREPEERCVNEQTLGLHLSEKVRDRFPVSNVAQYANQLMASMMREQVLNLCSNPDSVRRTVFIDSGDVDATEFNLSEARKSALVQAGSSCAKRYFEQPRTQCPEFILQSSAAAGGHSCAQAE